VRRLLILGFVLLSLPFSGELMAMDMTQFVRIPSSLSGLSGLLVTQSIDTLPPGRFELGLGFAREEGGLSDGSDFSISQLGASFTMGLTHAMEASLQIPYFAKIDGTEITGAAVDESHLGDVSLSVKWRFLEPSTALNFPGFGLSLTGFFPTGDGEVGAGAVESWGLKALLVSSAETEVGPSGSSILIGFYADWGIYVQDSGKETEESHGIAHLGLLVPLNKTRDIHLLLEGNTTTNLDRRFEKDYVRLTSALRYVTGKASWTLGYQRSLNDSPFEDANRFILHGTYFF